MAAPSISFVAFNVNTTLGCFFIGEVLTSILYGVSVVQIYTYFRRSDKEHIFMKALICFLLVLETLHLIAYTKSAYFYGVTNYMNPFVLLGPVNWSVQFAYVTGIVSECIILGIYTYRLYRLGGQYVWLTVVLPIFVELFSAGAGLAYVILAPRYNLPDQDKHIGWLFYLELSGEAVADILVAVSLCSALWRMRTGVRRTDSIIRILMKYSINTLALTSFVTIGCIVALAASPNTLIFVPLVTIHPKIMINSMLAFLNSRETLRTMTEGPYSLHLSKIRLADPSHQVVALQSAENARDTDKYVINVEGISGADGRSRTHSDA